MINLDIETNQQTVKVTLGEKRYTEDEIHLDLFNFYTNVKYTYSDLTVDYRTRFDEVIFYLDEETSNNELQTGDYEYNFYQYISGQKKSLEKGLCRVIDSTPEVVYEVAPNETDDDYITYTI